MRWLRGARSFEAHFEGWGSLAVHHKDFGGSQKLSTTYYVDVEGQGPAMSTLPAAVPHKVDVGGSFSQEVYAILVIQDCGVRAEGKTSAWDLVNSSVKLPPRHLDHVVGRQPNGSLSLGNRSLELLPQSHPMRRSRRMIRKPLPIAPTGLKVRNRWGGTC